MSVVQLKVLQTPTEDLKRPKLIITKTKVEVKYDESKISSEVSEKLRIFSEGVVPLVQARPDLFNCTFRGRFDKKSLKGTPLRVYVMDNNNTRIISLVMHDGCEPKIASVTTRGGA